MITKVHRNYLVINSLEELNFSKSPNNNCKLVEINPPDFQINKFFYKQVGNDHRWIDRLIWDDQKWMACVSNPNVKTFVLKENNQLVGYFEQIVSKEKNDCEIAYFGILKEFYGKKYGAHLLSVAIKKCFEQSINKVWLNTCSLDHKNALKNYLSRGMKIFKSETISLDIN